MLQNLSSLALTSLVVDRLETLPHCCLNVGFNLPLHLLQRFHSPCHHLPLPPYRSINGTNLSYIHTYVYLDTNIVYLDATPKGKQLHCLFFKDSYPSAISRHHKAFMQEQKLSRLVIDINYV